MKKVIAIDLDETLAELIDGALTFHDFKIKGTQVTKEDIEDYYIENIKKLGLNREEAIEWFYSFIESEAMHEIKLTLGAKQKLEEFKTKGHTLYIVTARRDNWKDLTTTRINKNLPNIFEENKIIFANHFTEHHRSKGEICKEIGAKIMIEDNFEYAKELASHGITTYLLAKPRNKQYLKDHPLIIKIDSRDEIHL